MPKFLWKTLKKGLVSDKNNFKWKIGKWYHTEGEIKCCNNGFHGSERIIDAMSYVGCEILALVEVKGENDKEGDKQSWSDMRIVKTHKWTKKDSVKLSIFAAELCLKNFEKEFPEDKRPREAIEAAKNWLKNPCKKTLSAAWSAMSAARSAESEKVLFKCEKFIIKEICNDYFAKK